MQAVILAGGKGTRLAERLRGRPKPLIDVEGVPLLQRQIEFLRDQGVAEFVVLVNHASDQIEAFLEAHRGFGCDVTTINDGEPRGTAGAVLACMDRLSDRFLVVYGDTLFNIDVSKMIAAHDRAGADATLFLHPNDHPQDSDLVEIDDFDRVTAFHPYPHPPGAALANQVNAAFYVMEKAALEPWREAPGLLDFGKDIFAQMLRAGARLQGYRSFEYIKDLGTPKRLDKVERHLREGMVERASLSARQACVFVDRDGTLNTLRGYVRTPEELELMSGVGEAVRLLNEAEFRVAVVTNQPVIARGDVTAEGLRRIHAKLETDLGAAGAFVDRIYYCPHHPDGGFVGERADLKIDCDCRKPKAGLLARAAADLNADPDQSWMVGDSTGDIAAARAFGVRSILVETGEGGRDGKCWVTPDFVVRDFSEAVALITRVYPRLADRARVSASQVGPGDLVLIGGLARAGKSTFAATLAHELKRRGLEVAVVSLDRWILPPDKRGQGVEARFDLRRAAGDLAVWLGGGALDQALPFYDRHARATVPKGPPVQLSGEGVLILEGVPALMAEFPTTRRAHRLFIGSAEEQRGRRVVDDLQARGGIDDPQSVYDSRTRDESPPVLASAETADVHISIDDLMTMRENLQ